MTTHVTVHYQKSWDIEARHYGIKEGLETETAVFLLRAPGEMALSIHVRKEDPKTVTEFIDRLCKAAFGTSFSEQSKEIEELTSRLKECKSSGIV